MGSKANRRSSVFVANRSCKRQIRLRSDLSGSDLLSLQHKDVYYTIDHCGTQGRGTPFTDSYLWSLFANFTHTTVGLCCCRQSLESSAPF